MKMSIKNSQGKNMAILTVRVPLDDHYFPGKCYRVTDAMRDRILRVLGTGPYLGADGERVLIIHDPDPRSEEHPYVSEPLTVVG